MELSIHDIIHNYLKFKENIESAAILTLKSYALDLRQAFLPENNNQITKQKTVKTHSDLWDLARPALIRWGNLSLASRNRKIATLKSFFGWLFNESLTDKNYAEQLVCPKVPKKIPHFLSVDEAISILHFYDKEFAKNDSLNEHTLLLNKTLFLLLYGGGLRVSEACSLRWKQIQFSEKRILIKGKGNKERFCILPDYSFRTLKQLQAINEKKEFVFGESGLNTRTGYEIIRMLGKKVGLLNPLHPHALRHSFATHLLASGANLRTLQTLLGHESLQATEKYTHLSVDHLARIMEQTHPLTKLKLES
ncbi:MAG: tyrosine-type recombinase/integrase [Pseudobdellovibrio sp.]